MCGPRVFGMLEFAERKELRRTSRGRVCVCARLTAKGACSTFSTTNRWCNSFVREYLVCVVWACMWIVVYVHMVGGDCLCACCVLCVCDLVDVEVCICKHMTRHFLDCG